MASVPVYLEAGRRRTFAAAIEWPGWCRSGRGEAAALEALAGYRDRYGAALGDLAAALPATGELDLLVLERLAGSATTDFGAPDAEPTADGALLATGDFDRLSARLEACWAYFDAVAGQSVAPLRPGPRGGGRSREAIRQHVLEADVAYLSRLGARYAHAGQPAAVEVRSAFLEALERRALGQVADTGPRGGRRWSARFALRRSAWHALDHAWEIEDRSGPG